MLRISHQVVIPAAEIQFTAIRSQGPGGQNVNKVASGIHLRFDIAASSLPDFHKDRLLRCGDPRITRDGIVLIKAQDHRSQLQNRDDALQRLRQIIQQAIRIPKKRKKTKPTRGAQKRRLDQKRQRSLKKALRGKVTD